MQPFQSITQRINEFRDSLQWRAYHKQHPKEMALGIITEAAEVVEHFRFRTGTTLDTYIKEHTNEIAEELVDTIYCCIALASDLDIDLDEAFPKKLAKTKEKYHVHPKYLDPFN